MSPGPFPDLVSISYKTQVMTLQLYVAAQFEPEIQTQFVNLLCLMFKYQLVLL